jgi:hypothetical protein
MDTSQAEIAAVANVAKKKGRTQHGQFNHVCTYPRVLSKLSGKTKSSMPEEKRGRQWTTADIAAEADREEDNCRHVLNPLKPVLVFGRPVSELDGYIEEVMSTAKQADGRKVRSDVHVLLAAVYSLPYRPDDYYEYKEDCDRFISDALKFHEKAYGKVFSAVMHLDESMVHWHVYTVDPDARMRVPGWIAKKKVMKEMETEGKPKKEVIRAGNAAYRQAMKELQDVFFDEVGERNGLARYGDRRMRYQPGEARAKRLEREQHARDLRAREEEAIRMQKKMQADLEAQELLNKAAAERLEEAIQEGRRTEHMSEYLDREKKRVRNTVEKLTSTPEFVRDKEIKKQDAQIIALKKLLAELEETIIVKDSIIAMLRAELSEIKQKFKAFINKLRGRS